MPRLFCARDRKRGSKLDAARFIRFEDYVHALVARRCGELLHGWRVRKQYRFLRGRKQLERVLKRETSSDLRTVVRIRRKLSEIEFFLEIIRLRFVFRLVFWIFFDRPIFQDSILFFWSDNRSDRVLTGLIRMEFGWTNSEEKKILEMKEGNSGFIWEPWTRLSNG